MKGLWPALPPSEKFFVHRIDRSLSEVEGLSSFLANTNKGLRLNTLHHSTISPLQIRLKIIEICIAIHKKPYFYCIALQYFV